MWIEIKRLVSTKRDIKGNTRYTDPIRSQADTGSNAVEIRHSHFEMTLVEKNITISYPARTTPASFCSGKRYRKKKKNMSDFASLSTIT